MTAETQLAVIGAGPAGMAAARAGADAGLDVVLLDEQAQAGGQIYRGLGRAGPGLLDILGKDYAHGSGLLAGLEHGGIRHASGATVWQVTQNRAINYSLGGRAHELKAQRIVLATGALERPMPFPGWTLPGVMSAGALQIALKSAGLVPDGVVLAGSGPLLLLLACQIVKAGGSVRAVVDTTPAGRFKAALPHLPAFLRHWRFALKGARLLVDTMGCGIAYFRNAGNLRALGEGHLQGVSFQSAGRHEEIETGLLALHQGVVPNVQITRSVRLAHDWQPLQRCWHPRTGAFGATCLEGIAVAGDGGGISGADAAALQGELAGSHAALQLGAISNEAFTARTRPVLADLKRHLGARGFVDALFAPAQDVLTPSDDTIVCRCEEVTAAQIRSYVALGCLGPNQTKAFGRSGMGPCQGRYCGLTVSEIIAGERGVTPADAGYYRLRPPIKPVTLGELAGLAKPEKGSPGAR